MKQGLLKYAFFLKFENKSEKFFEIKHKNRKNEAAASRIFIR